MEIHQASRIPELLQRAVRTALSGRPGPVLVSLPLDVQTAGAPAGLQPRARSARPAPQPGAVQDAARALVSARRPVIIVGGGLRGPGYDGGLTRLAELLQAPVVTTWQRKNLFPNDSSLYCGSLGYGAVPATEDLVREADVILAIGCRFSEFSTQRWTLLPPGAELIQVDIDPDSLGRYYVPAIGICADAREATAALATAVAALTGGSEEERAERQPVAAAARAAYRQQTTLLAAPAPCRGGVSSGALVTGLRTALDRSGAVLVQDAPSLGPWIQRYLDFAVPGSYYAASGGSMGWGFPAAMGMQLARPADRIITVSGDGSFWMVAQDLETAVREDLPIVNVINNNFSFGNTRDRQRAAHGRRYLGVFHGNADLAAFARLLGGHGERVERDQDLVPALERALASGRPAVVDVIQDRHEGLPPGLVPPPAAGR